MLRRLATIPSGTRYSFAFSGILDHSRKHPVKCKRDPYLRNLSMTYEQALKICGLVCISVLEIHYPAGGDWLFVNYDQFFDRLLHYRLEAILHASVNSRFLDLSLRSKPRKLVSTKLEDVTSLSGWLDTAIIPPSTNCWE